VRGLAALVLAGAELLSGCHPLTPAQEGAIVRSAIDSGRAACLVAQAKSLPITQAQVNWCQCKTVQGN
jgi:hypothetical protein